jgi:hypothetical protein
MRRSPSFLLVLSLLGCTGPGCTGQGNDYHGDASDGVLSDVPADGTSGDGRLTDVPAGEDHGGPVDGRSPRDGTGPDGLPDGGPDADEDVAGVDGDGGTGPGEPFGPCTTGIPCPGPGEICLLLPDSDTDGVCVHGCSPGGDDCPPWETCVVPNPDTAPAVGYCFLPAGNLEPCDPMEGRVCVDDRFCLAELGGEAAVCTDFCIADEALCPDLTSCRPVSAEGVAEG